MGLLAMILSLRELAKYLRKQYLSAEVKMWAELIGK